MPVYEYECRDCGKKVELLVKRGEKAHCPHCGSSKLKKLISTFVGRTRWQIDTQTAKAWYKESAPELYRAGIHPPDFLEKK